MADKFISGSIMQSGLKHHTEDYAHQEISNPVLGIVLDVHMSDDYRNTNSNKYSHDHRGAWCEASVLVVNDGSDSPWRLPNVIIPPRGSTGFDNFYEELPKATTGTIDDSIFRTDLTTTPREKLDGDYCVVDFIGGSINYPFMVSWWPHPANRTDPTTSNIRNNGVLAQGRRLARRFQGTRFVVTSDGTVMLDTCEANHLLKGAKRVASDEGGDVKISVKNNRVLDVNFNTSVFDPAEPDFLWGPNPVKKDRSTESTHIRFTKDEIQAIAGEMVNIIAQRGDAVISTPEGKIQLGAGATEPAVLGNEWQARMNELITAIKAITVPTAWGPSGIPLNGAAFDAVGAKLTQTLSDFIFGKKSAG